MLYFGSLMMDGCYKWKDPLSSAKSLYELHHGKSSHVLFLELVETSRWRVGKMPKRGVRNNNCEKEL